MNCYFIYTSAHKILCVQLVDFNLFLYKNYLREINIASKRFIDIYVLRFVFRKRIIIDIYSLIGT